MSAAPARRAPLAILYFFTALPMSMWTVPMSSIFEAHHRSHLIPFILAASAIAAFVSPLFIGALADQKIPPIRLLRWLTIGTSVCMASTATSLALDWPDLVILLFAQVQALIYIPVFGVATSIILAELSDAGRQFGPIRACATLGWMAGGFVVSFVLQADASLLASYSAAALWLGVAALTYTLPELSPTDVQTHRTWRQIWGLDALSLLRNRDHRVVFITAALYSIPLAAFYPYSPLQLKDLGVFHPPAVMSLAQITEILIMLGLATILGRFRLKWIFFFGIAIGVIRYTFSAFNTPAWVITGIVMHGLAYTLYFITTQVYLEDRIEPKWRVRAQSLLTLVTGGVGNLIGYLGGGWWKVSNQTDGVTDWATFWWGETALTAAVCLFFVLAYRGKKANQ